LFIEITKTFGFVIVYWIDIFKSDPVFRPSKIIFLHEPIFTFFGTLKKG